MYAIQHKPARLYNCDKTCITTVQYKYTKILRLKGKLQISTVQSREQGSLWQLSTIWVQLDTPFLHYLNFQENIWNQKWWMARCLDKYMRAIPQSGFRARFSPSGLFIHQTYKADGYYSHTRNLEVTTLPRENHVDIICLPPHNSHKMQWNHAVWRCSCHKSRDLSPDSH